MRSPAFSRAARRAGLGLAALYAIYVVGVALALRFGALGSLSAMTESVQISARSGHSWLPGYFTLGGVRIVVESYDVQLEITAREVSTRLSVSDLLGKSLHFGPTTGRSVTYRMRHEVHSVERNAARLRAFPSIEGFEDPPVYREPPEASEPDPNGWRVAFDSIDADLTEIWILEYRHAGQARISGGFLLQPGYRFRMDPARLSFDDVELFVADERVLSGLTGEIRAELRDHLLPGSPGARIVEHLSARVDLGVSIDRLGLLDLYLEPRTGIRTRGHGSSTLIAEIREGRLVRLRAEADLRNLSLERDGAELHGSARLEASSPGPGELTLVAWTERIAAQHRGQPIGSAEGLWGTLSAAGPGLHRMSVACASGRARRATIDDLRVLREAFERPPNWLPASGSVSAKLSGEHCAVTHSASAALDARLSRLLVRAGKIELDLSGTLDAEARLDTQSRQLELSRLSVSLDPLRLNREQGERAASVKARVTVREGRADLRGGDVSAKAYAHAGNPRPVIERMTSPPLLADIGIAALPLGATTLAADIERKQGKTELSLIDAESGSVRARGKLSFAPAASGRIFVNTPLLDFELRVRNGDVSFHPRDGD